MQKIGISILVPTKDRVTDLNICLNSLLDEVDEFDDAEIIILDQSKTNRADLYANLLKVKYIHLDSKGKSKALNRGVELAINDYLYVIDDDCIMCKGTYKEIKRYFLNLPQNCIFTGRVIAGERETGKEITILHDSELQNKVFKKEIFTPLYKLSGCNFGFRKYDYYCIGKFSEYFGPGAIYRSADDNEWGYRALNMGYYIQYRVNISVIHRSWRNKRQQLDQFMDYGYANGAFFNILYKNSKKDFLKNIFIILAQTIQISICGLSLFKRQCQYYYLINFLKGFYDFKKK